jgi:hypothetical protein
MAALFSATLTHAQDQTVKKLRSETERNITKDPADTIPAKWKKGGIYSLNLSQSSLSNWAAGGDDYSLSLNSLLSLFAFYKNGKRSWDNTFDFNLGYMKTSSLGSRKNDDRFDLLSKYGHAITQKTSITGLFNFRSQLFKGYTYTNNIKTYSSAFMAPGYVLLGLGVDYKPTKHLSIFLSPATARWVIVLDTALANKGLYGVSPGNKSIFEFGAFATINYLKEFSKSVTYKGRLDLFSNYLKKPQNVDLFMSNILNAKLGRSLAATWSVDLIYDDNTRLFGKNKRSAALQIKSLVGLGLLLKL